MPLPDSEMILGNRKLSERVVDSQRPLSWLSRVTDYLDTPELIPFYVWLEVDDGGRT